MYPLDPGANGGYGGAGGNGRVIITW
jgi:hypothetical protein